MTRRSPFLPVQAHWLRIAYFCYFQNRPLVCLGPSLAQQRARIRKLWCPPAVGRARPGAFSLDAGTGCAFLPFSQQRVPKVLQGPFQLCSKCRASAPLQGRASFTLAPGHFLFRSGLGTYGIGPCWEAHRSNSLRWGTDGDCGCPSHWEPATLAAPAPLALRLKGVAHKRLFDEGFVPVGSWIVDRGGFYKYPNFPCRYFRTPPPPLPRAAPRWEKMYTIHFGAFKWRNRFFLFRLMANTAGGGQSDA